jgi:hypothetical protein
MTSYTDPAHADTQIREASRHYARLGTAWFAFTQVVFVACFVLLGGGNDDTPDIDLIEIATYVGGIAAIVFVGFTILSLLVDRAGDIPPLTRDRRLADQQSAWIALMFVALAQLALAVIDVVN